MNVGSIGLKIGLVSEALRDLYVYTGGRTKIWDTCGPEAILAAAGGRMTDVDGNPLVYDQPDLYNRRGIVASNGPLHDFVIAALVPHRRRCRSGRATAQLPAIIMLDTRKRRALHRRARVEIVADRVDPLPQLVEVGGDGDLGDRVRALAASRSRSRPRPASSRRSRR